MSVCSAMASETGAEFLKSVSQVDPLFMDFGNNCCSYSSYFPEQEQVSLSTCQNRVISNDNRVGISTGYSDSNDIYYADFDEMQESKPSDHPMNSIDSVDDHTVSTRQTSTSRGVLVNTAKDYSFSTSEPESDPEPRSFFADINVSIDGNVNAEIPKYMKEYVIITNSKQRDRYMTDFLKLYEEYERVYKKVNAVCAELKPLSELLKKYKKNSKRYAKVKMEIKKKCTGLKSNRGFQHAKQRYVFLHQKLKYITDLVNAYTHTEELKELQFLIQL